MIELTRFEPQHDQTFSEPAAITGLGVIAPTGGNATEHWDAVLLGRSGLGRLTRFDVGEEQVSVVGEIHGFEASKWVPRRLISQTDRWTQLALAATAAALADSGANLDEFDEYEMAVITASSSGGNAFGQKEMTELYRHGPKHVTAYQSIAWFYAATTGQVAIRHQMRGPCGVVCAEQAGGLDAIAAARRLIRTGSQLVVTGGTDSALCPYAYTAQTSTGMMSTAPDTDTAYQPFTTKARGYVSGEGGAMLVVESQAGALARGADIKGLIVGHAAGFEPGFPRRGASVLEQVILTALSEAVLAPGDVDVVFADAAGDREGDEAEAAALNRVFGPWGVPVTAPKVLTGRLYGGGSSLDVATAVMALRDQTIPAAYQTGKTAPWCDGMDLVVGKPRPARLRNAVVLARGYGGFVSALIVQNGP